MQQDGQRIHPRERLDCAIELLSGAQVVADVGCDHGRLSCALIQRNLASGTLMAQILAVEPPLMGAEKCVLQPMRAAEDIRRWLYERNYPILADHVVLDAGRYYQVFSVGQPQAQKQPLPEGWSAGCFSLGYMAFLHREPLMKPLVEHMLATTRRKLRTQQADALREQAAQLEQILHHWEMKP